MGKKELRFRAPNPPPCFVGRTSESQWLTSSVGHSALVAIAGPKGIGKTSLLLHHLHAQGTKDDALFVAVRPGDPLESVLRRLLWALAGEGVERNAPFLAQEPEEAVAEALSMADASQATVVLDDLDHIVESDQVAEILIQIANFARSSRWLVTARSLPLMSELQGRSFVLPALGEEHLLELGAALSPQHERASVRRAAAVSKGSPWFFKQHLLAGQSAVDSARAGELAGLDPDSRALLDRMAVLRFPLPKEVLATLSGPEPDACLAVLARRGLVVEESGGYRAHDIVRGLCELKDEDRHDVSERLALSEDPLGWLEALRLMLGYGDLDAAIALLHRSGQELLARGEAPRMWTVLSTAADQRLRLWQARCASELGHATVLAAVGPPELSSASQHLEWAQMLYLQGNPAEALAKARAARDKSKGGKAAATDLEARCLIALGRAAEAESCLEKKRAHKALRTLAMALVSPDARAPAAPAKPKIQEMVDLAKAAFFRGELHRAEQLLDNLPSKNGGVNLSLFVWREAALLRARLDVFSGRLAAARARLDRLRPFVRGPTLLRPCWMLLDAELRIAAGQLEGLDEGIEQASELAAEMDHTVVAALELVRRSVHRLCGKDCPEAANAVPQLAYHGFDLTQKLRLSLLSGADPTDQLASMARRAEKDGLALLACEALSAWCEAAAILGLDHRDGAKQLLERAEAIASQRHAAGARYYLGLTRPGATEVAAGSQDPVGARRALTRLSCEVPLGALDQLFLRAAPTFGGSATTLGDGKSPAWGLWDEHQIIWMPDGAEIDLSRRALLYRLLVTLFEAGGEADKEHLITSAWEERSYHPLRHDQKLFVAVRTLRSQMGENKSAPRFLLTTDQGYALRQPVRRIRYHSNP